MGVKGVQKVLSSLGGKKTGIRSQGGIKSNAQYIKNNYFLYLLMAPAVILTLIFKYVPMYGVVIAFKDYSYSKGILGSEWVGFEYFIKFLNAPNFEPIFWNSLK